MNDKQVLEKIIKWLKDNIKVGIELENETNLIEDNKYLLSAIKERSNRKNV